MRIKTTTLYTYDELSDESKARAIESARARGWFDGSDWNDEWADTLKCAADALDLTVGDWKVSPWSYSHVSVETSDDDDGALVGVRAWKYLTTHYADAIGADGACPWTGYCGDESFLDPLRAFLLRPDTSSTIQDIMQACADSWRVAWESDMEYQCSDEAIAESLEANEHEFDEHGNLD